VPDSEPSGTYLLTVHNAQAGAASRLVVVTDLGLSAKRWRDGLLVWVTSLRDGAPIADAEVRLFTTANQELGSTRTGPDGVARLDYTLAATTEEPFLVTAAKGGDLSFLELNRGRVEFGEAVAGPAYPGDRYEACVFTDRGIYRPAETARVVCVVRGARLACPDPFPIELRVVRPDGRVFRREQAVLDAVGVAEFSVVWPDFLPTGRYTLEAALPAGGGGLGTAKVGLEEFVPPQIKVALQLTPERGRGGSALALDVSAAYLFGRPAAGLPASARLALEPAPFVSTNFPDFVFSDPEKEFNALHREIGATRLDDQGAAHFTADLPAGLRPPAALKAILMGTVVEASGRSVSTYASRPVDPYPYYIGLKPPIGGGVIRLGAEQNVEIAAARPDGAAADDLREVTVTLNAVQWTTLLRKQSDGTYVYESRRRLTPVQSASVALTAGRGTYRFKLEQSGEFALIVADPAGGASAGWRLNACAPDQDWVNWAMDKPERVELTLDRERYAPGDTARLMIKAPFSGAALLTIESDRVREHRQLQLDKNTAEVELPIGADYPPNVYCVVSVVRPVRGAELWTAHRAAGAIPLMVTPPNRRLNTAIAAPAEIRPGARLTAELKVTGADGAPAAEIEAMIAAVDEGICMLTDFATPDPLSFFCARRGLGVELCDLYSELLPIVDDNAGSAASPPGGDAGALRKRLNPISARRFVPVALWVSKLRTDSNGVATANFDVPEFAGRLRLMAVAIGREQMGSAESAVIVKRPLVVLSSLPRFMTPGDTCRALLNIFNETGSDVALNIQVECAGPLSVYQPPVPAMLAAGRQLAVPVGLKAGTTPGRATVRCVVTGGAERFEETVELAVRPPAALAGAAGAGVLAAGAQAWLRPPADWLAQPFEMQLWCAARPSIQLSGALNYLLQYPYGCIEQTVSMGFPLLYLADLARELRPESVGRMETGHLVGECVLRALSMQRGIGGFAAWPTDGAIYSWGSLYATHFLTEAARAGFDVPADRLRAAQDYVAERLAAPLGAHGGPDSDNWQDEMEERAYACYIMALAGRPQGGWMDRLREQAADLRVSARVHLAAALILAGQPRAAMELIGGVDPLQLPDQRQLAGCLNSAARDAALLLSAWLDLEPQHPTVDLLVQRLDDLKRDNRWQTTQENALALMALGKYYARHTVSNPPSRAALTWDGQAPAVVNTAAPFRQIWTNRPGAAVALSNAGPGRIFFSWRAAGVPTIGAVEELDQRLKIRREFLNVDGTPRATMDFRQGELAVVRLTIEPLGQMLDNVVIAELLPAGFEIENPELATSQLVPWVGEKSQWCRARDIRDDRLLLFTGPLGGKSVYYYAARAVTPGVFALPPADASCMYDPEIRSVHGAGTVRVLE